MKYTKSYIASLLLLSAAFTACDEENPLLVGGSSSGGLSGGSTGSSPSQMQTFTITYLVTEGGTMEGEFAQEVTLGVAYELNTLTRSGYTGYWTYEGVEIANTGIWSIAEDVRLESAWRQIEKPNEDDGWLEEIY